MKSFGGPRLDGMYVPRVSEMPDVSVGIPGQLLHLDRDEPNPSQNRPWFSRGTYSFNGYTWTKLGESERQRKAEIIGSQAIEVALPQRTDRVPGHMQGYQLALASLQPTNKRATVSGTAAAWLDHNKACNAWIAVFRDSRMVGMALTYLEPGKSQSVSLTFYDLPASQGPVTYVLRAFTDASGLFCINQANKFTFDGAASTAFIIEENN